MNAIDRLNKNPEIALNCLLAIWDYKTKQNFRDETNLVIHMGMSTRQQFARTANYLMQKKDKYWSDLTPEVLHPQIIKLFDDNKTKNISILVHPLGPMSLVTDDFINQIVGTKISNTIFLSMKNEIDYFENVNKTEEKKMADVYSSMGSLERHLDGIDHLAEEIHKQNLGLMPWHEADDYPNLGDLSSFKVRCSTIDVSHDVQRFLKHHGFKYLGYHTENDGQPIDKRFLLMLGNKIITFCDNETYTKTPGFTEIDENFLLSQGSLDFFKK